MGPRFLGKKGQRNPNMGTFSIKLLFMQGIIVDLLDNQLGACYLERYGEE